VNADEPSHQEITSFGGTAYGAIDADLYQHGPTTLALLLGDWPPVPADPEAEADDAGLIEIRTWLQAPERLAARWLYGLTSDERAQTANFAAGHALAAGWRAVQLRRSDEPPTESPVASPAGILVLVDDADLILLEDLTWAFSNALLFREHGPLRILLMAGSLDGWPAVRSALADRAIWTDAQPPNSLARPPGGSA